MAEGTQRKYVEVKDEREVIRTTAEAKLAVVHFYHVDFRTCKIMDRHLEELAERYPSTMFLRVDVANVPWLVNKLELRVLPCVIAFVDGVTMDRITGFEGVSDKSGEQVNSAVLELRLKQSGAIRSVAPATQNPPRKPILSIAAKKPANDDDDDWFD